MSEETRQTLLKGNPIVSNTQESEEDVVLNISLRPKKFTEFVGHKDIIENLQIAIVAARQRKEPLEQVLLSGPPGLGKTSLAHIIAHETGAKITATSGPASDRMGALPW